MKLTTSLRLFMYAVILAWIALVCVACDEPLPTAPTNVTQVVTVVVNPAPGASPSPGAGGCPVESLRVGFFGFGTEKECEGLRNGGGQLRVGCLANGTATPKGNVALFPPNGDVPLALHGSAITWSVLVNAQAITFTEDMENAFNFTAVGREPAPTVVIQATLTPPNCPTLRGQMAFEVIP